MIREAKRKDLEYKRSATAEFAKYLNAFPNVNLFEEVKEIVQEGLEELNEDEDNDLQMKPMYVITLNLSNYSRLLLRANLYSIASAGFQPAIDPEKTQNASWIINL